jgi:aldehyde dehydrogenase (NAD+)
MTPSFTSEFQALKAAAPRIGTLPLSHRRNRLNALRAELIRRRSELHAAMRADLNRPEVDSDLNELLPVKDSIDHVLANLSRWTRTDRLPLPLTLIPGRAEIHHEPKGVALIVSPWNFPVNLCLVPLVYAVGAGNTVCLKPSELAPASAAFIASVVEAVFPADEVCVIQGDVSVAVALLEQPWNHIFFTGSPGVGSKVMAAASKYLASVTLELGGKSPVFVHEGYGADAAGRRVAWAKGLNAGQVCIAPDYALVPAAQRADFIQGFKAGVAQHYGNSPATNPDWVRIIQPRHWDRLNDWLQEAIAEGAKVWQPDAADRDRLYFPPTLVWDAPEHLQVSCSEIFGPILPVFTYTSTEDALARVNAGPQPLVLYILSHMKSWTDRIIRETRAGGTVVNDFYLHYIHPELPFGGVNNSGIGKSHGIWGFREFSNARSVYRRGRFAPTMLLTPPYKGWVKKVVGWLVS